MNPRFNIVAPIGGFGNHVRWLACLDPAISLMLTPPSNEIFCLTTTEEKVQFITNRIYFQDRSWNNWLEVEWRYRESMNNSIFFGHSHIELQHPEDKTLVLTVDPELAHYCYLKFNSNLNNRSKERFFKDIVSGNEDNIAFANNKSTAKVLKSDVLFQPELDKDFYYQLIDFFGLKDLYNSAQQIHTLWYLQHKQAEIEFVEYIKNVYK